MNGIILHITFLIIIFTWDCMAQNDDNMKKLLWIVDSWVSTDGDARSYENWEKINEDLYIGGSKTVKNGDTLFSESLKLEKTSEGIFYIADVKHNPAPVRFMLTEVSETSAVFKNPDHDFPQKISYELKEGNLHALIEGPGKDGK